MIKMYFKENNFGNIIAISSILAAFAMIYEWKEYEAKIISEAKKPPIDSLNYDKYNISLPRTSLTRTY